MGLQHRTTSIASVLFLWFGLSACPSSSNSTQPQPESLSYTQTDAVYWVSLAIAPNDPIATGYSPNGFTVDPALPAGLALDPLTGQITGTPLAPLARTTFEIEGTIGSTSHSAAVRITIHADQPPTNLVYPVNPARYPRGAPGPENIPTFDGGVESFSANPPLPSGLQLRPTDGAIRGVATQAAGLSQHVITATNPFGSAQTTVDIDVFELPPFAGFLTLHGGLPATLSSSGPLTPWVQRGVIDVAESGTNAHSVATSSDGRFVFVAHGDNRIRRHAVDLQTGRVEDAVVALQILDPRLLGFDDTLHRLIIAGGGYVAAFDVAFDGSLTSAALGVGPALPQALCVDSRGRGAVVASSDPLTLQVLELDTLVQRGGPVAVEPSVYVTGLECDLTQELVLAVGYHYSGGPAQGRVHVLRVATATEVQGGAPAVVSRQMRAFGGVLGDATTWRDGPYDLEQLLIAEPDARRVHSLRVDSFGSFYSVDPPISWSLPQTPVALVAIDDDIFNGLDDPELFVMCDDGSVWSYKFPLFATTWQFHQTFRTRPAPIDIVARRQFSALWTRGTAFAVSGADSVVEVLAVEGSAPGVWANTGNGMPTGAGPVDVERHPDGHAVYTVNRVGGSLSVFGYDAQTRALTPIEEEQLGLGVEPYELCFDPAGRFGYVAVGYSGASQHDLAIVSVSGADGALTTSGLASVSSSGPIASLAIEPTGRFLFAAVPADREVRCYFLNPQTGAAVHFGSTVFVGRPTWVQPLPNGRHLLVIDSQVGSMTVFAIDADVGALTAVSTFNGLGLQALHASLQADGNIAVVDMAGQSVLWLDFDPVTSALSAPPQTSPPVLGADLRARAYTHPGARFLLLLEDDGAATNLRCYRRALHMSQGQPTTLTSSLTLGRPPLALQFTYER